ncbi:MAG: Clp protease N-terminal domain-containing protein [Candidatus Korobacteraceae bacterium]
MHDYYTLAVVSGIIILLGLVYFSIRRGLRRRAPHFSSEAQRAIGFARVEAELLNSSSIAPVHLLLGLLHVPIPSIVSVLPLEEHNPIRQEVRERVGGAALVTYRDDLPYTDEARQVLVAAAREARALESPAIAAEHLLLGLLHAEASVAALILRERGLRLETLRQRLAMTPEYSTQ